MADAQANQGVSLAPPASDRTKKKKACAECRQQKMRCDAMPDSSEPCSRCRRLDISCSISPTFKRTHKRKRLQELEEETAALKQQLLSSGPTGRELVSLPSIDDNSIIASGSLLPLSGSSQPNANFEEYPINALSREAAPRRNIRSHDPTVSRSLDGLELEPGMIDDCFLLYFRHYHHVCPLMDPSLSPNYVHGRAPFLFWMIISIGSRRYSTHPRLVNALAPRVTHLAFTGLNSRSMPMQYIKGLILLLSWPFSSTSFYRDPSFVLSGSLLHLAMQSGLHTPAFSHDFAKTDKERHTPKSEQMRRAEIWLYVVLTYQRSCSGSGQPALAFLDVYNEQAHFKPLLDELPPTLKLQMKIASATARAQKAFIEIGLVSMNLQQERTMDSLLKVFDGELKGLEIKCSTSWDFLYLAAARQDIAAMHFYKSEKTLNIQSSIAIFEATSKVLEQIQDLENNLHLSRICTRFIFMTTFLGMSFMVRLLKGPFASYLDYARGSALYQRALLFIQSCSLEKTDLPERAATALEQIWKSEKIFKSAEGSVDITLRVRNRLSASPIYDAIRWWREEFVEHRREVEPGQPGLAAELHVPSISVGGDTDESEHNGAMNNAPSDLSMAPNFLLGDGLWDDFNLADDWILGGPDISWMS